ncbi:MAG: ABC transporter ATP-binding protein [Candidatus Latescibacterota bacterium]|jgi:ATP-binding cassette subfamily B protein
MSTVSPFIEPIPVEVDAKLSALRAAGEEVRLQVATDMSGLERFGERWLVVTDRQVLVLHGEGPDGAIQVPLPEIAGARIEALVGGGRLEVEHKEGPPTQLYYSSSLTAKFAEVADGIRRLAEGKELVLATELERSRCPRCRRMLPEKGGVCPACVRKRDTFGRLLGYLRPYRGRAAVLVLLTVGASLLSLIPPYLVKLIIDRALPDPNGFGLLVLLVGGLLGIGLLSWGAEVTRRWLNTWVGFRAVETIRSELFRALQFLPLRFYDRRKVGSLISRMTNDSDLVEMYLLFDLPYVISNSLMVITIIGLLLSMNWQVTMYVLVPVPLIVITGSLVWKRLQGSWRRWSIRWSRLSSHLNESITGIRVIKGFAQEEREGARFDERNQALRDVTVTAERVWMVFFMVTNFFMSFGAFFVWYFGGRQVLAQTLSLGTLMAFISYLWMLYGPLRWFGDFYSFMVRAFAGAERIFEVIDARPEPFADPEAVPMPAISGRVAFEGVTFGYDPGKPVLKEIDLAVAPGEMIGLVGRSGAGKSSLIKLICRFYEVSRGTLSIDGVDIRRIRLEDLRCQIGMVAQESFLFNDTIAENIRYGRPGATFDEILRASRAANAHEFIVQKPDGYDMVVGENGNRLSGGEKQRLAIARAILHDPRILILDEATSSLDTQTERKIQEAIGRLVAGRTTFAIAHRLSTLRHADRLVVIDEGRVAEVGTHEELMAREGVFYKLVRTQQETTAVMVTGADEQ